MGSTSRRRRPAPLLTIDRLLLVELVPRVRGSIRVLLDGACMGMIPAGPPIVRHGVTNAALGIEQVSVLDIAWQLPCNQDRVWVRSDELTVTNRSPED